MRNYIPVDIPRENIYSIVDLIDYAFTSINNLQIHEYKINIYHIPMLLSIYHTDVKQFIIVHKSNFNFGEKLDDLCSM